MTKGTIFLWSWGYSQLPFVKFTWGPGEIISPGGCRAEPCCNGRAFTEADLRSKSAQRAQICAPQGHALGGRTPDMHRVAWMTVQKNKDS